MIITIIKSGEHLSPLMATHFFSHKKFIVTKVLVMRTYDLVIQALGNFQMCTAAWAAVPAAHRRPRDTLLPHLGVVPFDPPCPLCSPP